MKRSVELICVGNELLTGHTLNTNVQWMGKEITRAGGIVRRVTIVRDEVQQIAASIRESLRRKPGWIIISGGLGPTYDDKTLQGLAKALSRKLVLNKGAVRMLKRKYSETSNPALTPARYKMAALPAGSKPLENPVGHAPGVWVEHASCTIFAVPGVPLEMDSIFSVHVKPGLKLEIGRFVRKEVNFEIKGLMESLLAPYLDILVAENPNVYFKSHPKGYSGGLSMLHVNITAEATDTRNAVRRLKRAALQMRSCIRKAGGNIRQI